MFCHGIFPVGYKEHGSLLISDSTSAMDTTMSSKGTCKGHKAEVGTR
jgi:hypothetical protein